MSLLDINIQDVLITPEGLLNERFNQVQIYTTGSKLDKYTKKIVHCNGRFYFDITFYVDLHPGGQWTIKIDVGNLHRMIETWHGQRWVHEGMMIIPMKPRPIHDMQELQMMLTEEWIKAWLTDLVVNGKLQFEYSEIFVTRS